MSLFFGEFYRKRSHSNYASGSERSFLSSKKQRKRIRKSKRRFHSYEGNEVEERISKEKENFKEPTHRRKNSFKNAKFNINIKTQPKKDKKGIHISRSRSRSDHRARSTPRRMGGYLSYEQRAKEELQKLNQKIHKPNAKRSVIKKSEIILSTINELPRIDLRENQQQSFNKIKKKEDCINPLSSSLPFRSSVPISTTSSVLSSSSSPTSLLSMSRNDILDPSTSSSSSSSSSSSKENNNKLFGGGGDLSSSFRKQQQKISSISSSSSLKSERSSSFAHYYGHVGLSNIGNTCFMNSGLQVLSNVPPLRKYFLSGAYEKDLNLANRTKGRLAKSFAHLLNHLWEPQEHKRMSYTPRKFKKILQRYAPMFRGYEQHDSQEFLKFFLDGLHEDLNKVTKKPKYEELKDIQNESVEDQSKRYWKNYVERNESIISNLFCGQLKSTLTCRKCRHQSISFDPFFDISVPIPEDSKTRKSSRRYFIGGSDEEKSYSLKDCFNLFTEEELLSGDEKPFCKICKKHRVCCKRISIFRSPKVLVVLLKRFNGRGRKMLNEIDFPKTFNLKAYIDPEALTSKKLNGGKGVCRKYGLIGVVNHLGSLYGGHYIAYTYNSKMNKWLCYNDSNVKSISESRLHSSSAYVLFYLRKDLFEKEYKIQ